MNATFREMCERFGPGYRVLDARFTCVDVEDNEGFSDGRNRCPSTDRATAPGSMSTGIALARSPRCAQVHRPFDHPVPGQPRAGTRRRRRRKPTFWRRLKEFRVQRTPLLAAATGVALSLLLAMVLPQSRSSAFDGSRNIVVASSNSRETAEVSLAPDELAVREYCGSLARWRDSHPRPEMFAECEPTMFPRR